MKRLFFIILLIACAKLVSHAYIVVDGVHYSTYWAGSVQEAVVVFGDPDAWFTPTYATASPLTASPSCP